MSQETKKIDISWAEIFGTMQRMSSFEGRNAISASGESMYEDVKITSQDQTLINDYIVHATSLVEDALGNMVTDVEVPSSESGGSTSYIFTVDSARASYSTVKSILKETIASYAMSLWMSDKTGERDKFYAELTQQMITNLKKVLARKSAPVLTIATA